MKADDIVKLALELAGYPKLNPVQRKALKHGLLDGRNLVVAAPTASGKTFIAELAALNTIINQKKKAVYLVPLVALASEKYQEFKERYSKLGIKVAISVGDYDAADPWLEQYDLIVLTNEKMDSLLRHGVSWVNEIGLIVCDEVHLLDSPDRGPTLEVTLTKLRMLCNAQILALSATIKNAEEIAEWLNAEVVESNWRPVKLYKGIAFDHAIYFETRENYELNPSISPIELAIAENTLNLGKQALYFVATRRYAEALAEKLAPLVQRYLTQEERELLQNLASEVLNVLEPPTRQCERLAKCIRNGVAFHHAGLLAKQRKVVEDSFRSGVIKLIVATPTLAAGVNLPAFRVIIRDLRRYYPLRGSVYLPVLEVMQMLGRAGRPKYDKWGEGILIARSKAELRELVEHYLHGEVEEIYSRLGMEPVLRTHVLALIASGLARNETELEEFFSKTFYAKQYGDLDELLSQVEKVLSSLIAWKFVEVKEKKYEATRLGRRVVELYLDPLSAHVIIDVLAQRETVTPLGLLHLLTKCAEMFPLLHVSQRDWYELDEQAATRADELIFAPPEPWSDEYEDFLCELKTALALEAWINEASEASLLERFRLTPGELRARIEIADWLLYSAKELMLLLRNKTMARELRKLRLRVIHGVREDLLSLVSLEGIGRVRARKLANAGIKTIAQLRKVPLATLEFLLGPKIARKVKEQVSKGEVDKSLLELGESR